MHTEQNPVAQKTQPTGELITVAWADAHAPAGYAAAKRALDVAVVLIVLIVGLPIWLLLALLIKLTSPGPVFYRGTVVGGGDNTAHKQWLEQFVKQDAAFAEDESGKKVFKVVNDPRITSVGRILRKLSLDEVPQMLNVLTGDMSLVGPRPPVPYEYQHYDDYARQRLSVPPGITGLYQVTARSQVGFSGMVAIDLDYIRRRSLWLDLQIMVKTPVVMLLGKGAG